MIIYVVIYLVTKVVSENTYYILLDNKKELSDIHTLSFKLKDLKKNRKKWQKIYIFKIFSRN